MILSDDAWNDWAPDAVVLPVFDNDYATPSLLRPEIEGIGIADCTLLQSIPDDWMGEVAGWCSPDRIVDIRGGVASFLCIQTLRQGKTAPRPRSATNLWFPEHAGVYYATGHEATVDKMHAVLTDNDWNANQAYVASARLTSRLKGRRSHWEVTVRGGCIVVGNLELLDVSDIGREPPQHPRPRALVAEERVGLARGISALLGIP